MIEKCPRLYKANCTYAKLTFNHLLLPETAPLRGRLHRAASRGLAADRGWNLNCRHLSHDLCIRRQVKCVSRERRRHHL